VSQIVRELADCRKENRGGTRAVKTTRKAGEVASNTNTRGALESRCGGDTAVAAGSTEATDNNSSVKKSPASGPTESRATTKQRKGNTTPWNW